MIVLNNPIFSYLLFYINPFNDIDEFSEQRKYLLDNVQNIDSELLKFDENNFVHIILYGSASFNFLVIKSIHSNTIDYMKSTKRFRKLLF